MGHTCCRYKTDTSLLPSTLLNDLELETLVLYTNVLDPKTSIQFFIFSL